MLFIAFNLKWRVSYIIIFNPQVKLSLHITLNRTFITKQLSPLSLVLSLVMVTWTGIYISASLNICSALVAVCVHLNNYDIDVLCNSLTNLTVNHTTYTVTLVHHHPIRTMDLQ